MSGQALGDGPGQRAGHAGVDDDHDPPPLVRVGIAAVPRPGPRSTIAALASTAATNVVDHSSGRAANQASGCRDRVGAQQIQRRQSVGGQQRRGQRDQASRQARPAGDERRRRREVEHRQADHGEAERRQQPREEHQRLAQERGEPGFAAGQCAADGDVHDHRQRHERRDVAAHAQRHERQRRQQRALRCAPCRPDGGAATVPWCRRPRRGTSAASPSARMACPDRETVSVKGRRTSSHQVVRHPASAAAALPRRRQIEPCAAIVGRPAAPGRRPAGRRGRQGPPGVDLGHLGIERPRQVGRPRSAAATAGRPADRRSRPARRVKPAPAGKAVGRVTNTWTPT